MMSQPDFDNLFGLIPAIYDLVRDFAARFQKRITTGGDPRIGANNRRLLPFS